MRNRKRHTSSIPVICAGAAQRRPVRRQQEVRQAQHHVQGVVDNDDPFAGAEPGGEVGWEEGVGLRRVGLGCGAGGGRGGSAGAEGGEEEVLVQGVLEGEGVEQERGDADQLVAEGGGHGFAC